MPSENRKFSNGRHTVMEEEKKQPEQSGQPETERPAKRWYSGIQNWFLSWTGKKAEKSKQAENRKNLRNEALMKQLSPDVDENTREYIRGRVIEQMNYYSAKSRQYRKTYQRFTTATIILGGAIPVCSFLDSSPTWVNFLTAILGACITGINTGYRELWITCRNTLEALLNTLYAYINGAGAFEQTRTQEQKNVLLINTCEDILAHESGRWIHIINSAVQSQGGEQN